MTIGIKVTTKKQILESQNRKCDSITVLKVVTIVIKVTTKKQILESQSVLESQKIAFKWY